MLCTREFLNTGHIETRIAELRETFAHGRPFRHLVIDNFYTASVAEGLAAEIERATPAWHRYDNPIEVKLTCNVWNEFPTLTYQVFSFLTSERFVSLLREVTGCEALIADCGLHGGGWHRHGRGGKLNAHLDYSIHPKTGMQRKLNLITYVSPNWDPAWGGGLGFWAHDAERNRPGALLKLVDCLFNRAVLFDTTQNSWHGLANPIACPEDTFRTSLAVYYMMPASEEASRRERALFAPHKDQENDPAVLELIRRRSASSTAADVYRTA